MMNSYENWIELVWQRTLLQTVTWLLCSCWKKLWNQCGLCIKNRIVPLQTRNESSPVSIACTLSTFSWTQTKTVFGTKPASLNIFLSSCPPSSISFFFLKRIRKHGKPWFGLILYFEHTMWVNFHFATQNVWSDIIYSEREHLPFHPTFDLTYFSI